MSHNNYIIVDKLVHKEYHVRALAKELKTNQTTVARRLKELRAMNVVDYKDEGRNRVYHMKDSLEARQAIFIAEHEKITRIIRKHPRIRQIVEQLQHLNVAFVVLYGSYAKGTEAKESDIDLYAETTDQGIRRSIAQMDSGISIKIGTYDKENPLIQEIAKHHVVLKGVEAYYARVLG